MAAAILTLKMLLLGTSGRDVVAVDCNQLIRVYAL